MLPATYPGGKKRCRCACVAAEPFPMGEREQAEVLKATFEGRLVPQDSIG